MASRILVVDDSPTVLRVVESVLSGAGYRVFTARSGADGLDLARQEAPDLILLDFIMPKMNGYHFCKKLSDDSEIEDIPVVMMTTKSDMAGDRFVTSPEIVDYITKPFSPEAVLAVTSYTLEKQARRVEAEDIVEDSGDDGATTPGYFIPPETDPGAGLVENLTASLADSLKRHGLRKAEKIARAAAEEALTRLPPLGEQAHIGGVAIWCDLSHVPLPEIMQLLQLQAHTGLFQIWYSKTRYDIYIRNGRVVAARAQNADQEFWLGRFLIARGFISQAELEQLVLSAVKKGGLPLGEKLVRLGLIRAEDLRLAISDQCCELVYEALRIRQGTCCFVSGVLPPPEFDDMQLNIDIQTLLLEGLRRVDEWGLIESEVDSFDAIFTLSNPTPAKLTSDERRLLGLVNGHRSVRDLVGAARMRPFEACKLLYRLAATRQIVQVPGDLEFD